MPILSLGYNTLYYRFVRYLVTGAAGFIGQSLSKYLLFHGHRVLAIDSMNSYYSNELKKLRIKELYEFRDENRFAFTQMNLCDKKIFPIVENFAPETVVHLAAQPGVRLGLSGSTEYSRDNIEAFLKILRLTIAVNAKNFLYASSSSVYGSTSKIPFSEKENSLRPTSIYGVTKLANELFTSTTIESEVRGRGLRFFSVYGPKGRPDMAYFRAIAASFLGTTFYMNGTGEIARDFTFIDDVCESIMLLGEDLSKRSPGFSDVVNIGGGVPITINRLIDVISQKTRRPIDVVKKNALRDDLELTKADYGYLYSLINKKKFTDFDTGISKTISWFAQYPNSTICTWLD